MGMLRAESGEAHIFGLPVTRTENGVRIRQRIGFVAEEKELYPYMTVEQIIRFMRPLYPRWREDLERRYLDMFELPPKLKIPKLSKGMRSKLMLLLAISRGAELLILDEPMEGLDPSANIDVLKELVELAAGDGITIFFSSHQITDVEQISDHVCIIDHGVARVAGALDDMKIQCQRVQIVFPDEYPASVEWGDGVEQVHQEGRMVSFMAPKNVAAILARAQSIPGALVESYPLTLKEIYLGQIRSH